jgi:hypothetical protein
MTATIRLLAVLATALLASPAFAQPGVDRSSPGSVDNAPVQPGTVVLVPGPPPPAGTPVQIATIAPHNEDWNNVSHINGQVVKVGERGDYLYRWKTTNIATNPIGWMFGFYGLSISRAVHDNIALRGDANVFSFDHNGGYEVGFSVPIYFRRVFSGPFFEPGVLARNISSSCDACNPRDASVGPEVLVGWHWTFDSGFNLAMAIGAMRNVNSNSTSIKAEPAGYFRIGYAL